MRFINSMAALALALGTAHATSSAFAAPDELDKPRANSVNQLPRTVIVRKAPDGTVSVLESAGALPKDVTALQQRVASLSGSFKPLGAPTVPGTEQLDDGQSLGRTSFLLYYGFGGYSYGYYNSGYNGSGFYYGGGNNYAPYAWNPGYASPIYYPPAYAWRDRDYSWICYSYPYGY